MCFYRIKSSINKKEGSKVFLEDSNEAQAGSGRAISMGFYYPSKRLFGVPSREATVMLENTNNNPYELFATD